jgi:uncharacterized beta-barrel protein YwiB (DUF1934 family)
VTGGVLGYNMNDNVKRVNVIQTGVPVRVNLVTTIEQDGQQQQFKFDEPGQLVLVNGHYYLRYHETDQHTSVPVTFRFDDDQTVMLSRSSENRLRIMFNAKQDYETHYKTAYGMMKLIVKTQRLLTDLDLMNAYGKLAIDYELHAQGQLIGKYQIRLQFNA